MSIWEEELVYLIENWIFALESKQPPATAASIYMSVYP